MRLKNDDLLGFFHRIVYAALVSLVVWISVLLPIPDDINYSEDIRYRVVRWLDLPIAIATQLMPCDDSALDLWFRTWCLFPEVGLEEYLFYHMRIGVPAYVMLFYIPTLFCAGCSWWRRRCKSGLPFRLPENPGDSPIGRRHKKCLLGFCHRVAYATLIAAIVWMSVPLALHSEHRTPPASRGGIHLTLAQWLNLPVAVSTQLLPCDEAAADLWFRHNCPERFRSWPYLLQHLRVGIPTYVLLFYLPSIYRCGRSWWRRRRGSGP